VLSLYYYDELTMKEIGGVMELTESRRVPASFPGDHSVASAYQVAGKDTRGMLSTREGSRESKGKG